jgi:hypothetical protein
VAVLGRLLDALDALHIDDPRPVQTHEASLVQLFFQFRQALVLQVRFALGQDFNVIVSMVSIRSAAMT